MMAYFIVEKNYITKEWEQHPKSNMDCVAYPVKPHINTPPPPRKTLPNKQATTPPTTSSYQNMELRYYPIYSSLSRLDSKQFCKYSRNASIYVPHVLYYNKFGSNHKITNWSSKKC